MSFWGYPKYVSVAERKAKAQKKIASLKKKGQTVNPVCIEGRAIARTFWGKAWCKHLESYSDFENRLPRGRTYVRNGSILDLLIVKGEITALVQGSDLYKVSVKIDALEPEKWKKLVTHCSGKIDSLLGLLQGKFSQNIMEYIIDKDKGLFPDITNITLNCSCPDYADMCKHVAAVLYGVGARLDHNPEALFIVRHVNHLDLVQTKDSITQLTQSKRTINTLEIDTDLSDLFGIDFEDEPKQNVKNKKDATKPPVKKTTEKKKEIKKSVVKKKTKPKKRVVKKVKE